MNYPKIGSSDLVQILMIFEEISRFCASIFGQLLTKITPKCKFWLCVTFLTINHMLTHPPPIPVTGVRFLVPPRTNPRPNRRDDSQASGLSLIPQAMRHGSLIEQVCPKEGQRKQCQRCTRRGQGLERGQACPSPARSKTG